ncbi:HalOD1 output domain-containing protein [Halopiger goleimassiliensis]|uniref:HalOD1 output domain-containing protein n=1 Tax=Halopiger goleimassiliensis TaxID=1293048 RepID=UPI000677BCA6|nr:HalOD1 output domain-containing protein [Halopiger goleimassiliensis]
MGIGEKPSLSIVNQVAAAEGIDPFDLEPPLGEVVDTDALDALVASTRAEADVTVEFVYRGRPVRVDSTGTVDVGEATVTEEARTD